METLLDAIARLATKGVISHETFQFEVFGNLGPVSALRVGLRDLVVSRPYIPHADALGEMAKAGALVVIEDSYIADFGYSAKLFDYLVSRRPILAITPTWGGTAEIVTGADLGIVVEPGDVDAIEAALLRLIKERRGDITVGEASWDALKKFNRRTLTKRLARHLDDLFSGQGSPRE